MSRVTGPGFVSLVDEAFAGDLSAVIPEPASGTYIFITGGSLRLTGAAAILGFEAGIRSDQVDYAPVADIAGPGYDLDDGETLDVPPMAVLASTKSVYLSDAKAGGPLNITGGAVSAVLNGTIYYVTLKLGSLAV